MNAILDIEALSVALRAGADELSVVDAVSLRINAGETVCLVGESGSGKTVTALAVTRLIDYRGGTITAGAVRLDGHNLAALSQNEMGKMRGRRIGFVFQEPMTAFDPLFSIGDRVAAARPHPGRGTADRPVSARAIRRDAPAGDDRHGAGLPPATAHRR